MSVILFSVLLISVLTLLNLVAAYFQNSITSVVGKNLTARLRKELFAQLQRLTLDWHNRQKKGDIVQRIIGDVAELERFVTDGLLEFVSGLLTIIGTILIVLLISLEFTLLFTAIIPILFVIAFIYLRNIRMAIRRVVKAGSEVAGVATEDVAAIALIKGFTLEERESMRFTRYVWRNRDESVRADELQAQPIPIVRSLVGIIRIITLGVGAYVAAGNTFTLWLFIIPSGTLTVGSLTVFLTYLIKLFQPIRDVTSVTGLALNASVAAERLQEVFNQAPEVVETTDPYMGNQFSCLT